MTNNIITADKIILKDNLKYNGKTVLTYRIEYPQFKSPIYKLSLAVINNFYRVKALEYEKYYKNELFNSAVEQYKFDKENGYPIRAYDALITYKVTYNQNCILSLYFDKYEYTGGAHGNTLRYSQTFNLQKVSMLRLNQLVKCKPDYKSYLLSEVLKEIRKNPEIYFDDSETMIEQAFNEESIYCTPNGIIIYFQQYDIAPYSSGIREFFIPYSNCVINPVNSCHSIEF